MSSHPQRESNTETPDLAEKGRSSDGSVIRSDRRLYVQFHAFTNCTDISPITAEVQAAGLEAAVYRNVADPRGFGLVTFSEDPNHFVTAVRDLLLADVFLQCDPDPQLTMFGRSYSIGYESDLDETLLRRPRHRILNPEWPWVVWYPLRRRGDFEQLPADEQRKILGEHAAIGRSFGTARLAYDIRLTCHGMDRFDNDFVVGLVGRDLLPLSAVVAHMRKTVQTSLYLERLGPFFVGQVAYQSPMAIA